MGEILEFGAYSVDAAELKQCRYHCDPALCKGDVCCRMFDIALTLEERARISGLIPELIIYCPWLADYDNVFKVTPCEIFIKKQQNGLCLFNWEDKNGSALCAIHSLALAKNINPFKLKPLNCSMWPFLRNGANFLELDRDSAAPCLQFSTEFHNTDPELLDMLEKISE